MKLNLTPSKAGGISAAVTAVLIPVFNLLDVFDWADLNEDKQQAITSVLAAVIIVVLAFTGNKTEVTDA